MESTQNTSPLPTPPQHTNPTQLPSTSLPPLPSTTNLLPHTNLPLLLTTPLPSTTQLPLPTTQLPLPLPTNPVPNIPSELSPRKLPLKLLRLLPQRNKLFQLKT